MLQEFSGNLKGTLVQLLTTLSSTLIAVSNGMQIGWSSPVTSILLSENSPIETTQDDIDMIESLLMAGMFIGMPFTVFIIKRFGQKRATLLSASASIIFWAVLGISNKIEYILAVRFFHGMAANIAYVSVAMFIAEISEISIRGILSNLLNLMEMVGYLLVYSITPVLPIYGTSLIGAAICILQLVTFPLLPDSPYYLIQQGKLKEAKQDLSNLRQTVVVEEEFFDIQSAVHRQTQETRNIKDIWSTTANRKALIIATLLISSPYMGGFNAVLMNFHFILNEGDKLDMTLHGSSILFVCLLIFAAAIGSILTDIWGRKILLLVSSTLTGFCLIVMASYFGFRDLGFDVSNFNWTLTSAVLFYAVAIKLGLAIVPQILLGELFSVSIKSFGISVADATYAFTSIMSIQIFYFLTRLYGLYCPLLIFAAYCFLTVVFTVLYVPETKGKSLEEIQFILKGEVYVSRHNSIFVPQL